ncbi:MAG: ABC transporter ATP-binding protein [Clostridiales bacterium]|jgi:ABC-type sugar transport system ATPase subunit|nr:ABC transporter ATP-binding protein [Clostridiales bacterium]
MKVVLKNLTKKFGDIVAVNDLSIEIKQGEITALLGGSGSGKSTTLNMISGIESVTSGKIFFDDTDVTKMSIEKRNVGYVFQDYLLYPNMNIFDNIAFPLKMKKVSKDEITEKTELIAKALKITEQLKKRPGELSGGQQQRVAIARALVKDPAVLLLDEPFSNLDTRLSLELHDELLRVQKRTGVTAVYVTHNQEDAMMVSHNIVVLKDGECMQYSSPDELYHNPQNYFVANFIGKVEINKIDGNIVDKIFVSNDQSVKLDLSLNLQVQSASAVSLCFRPESVKVSQQCDFDAKVVACSFYGKDVMIKAKSNEFYIHAFHNKMLDTSDSVVGFCIDKNAAKIFDQNTGERIL